MHTRTPYWLATLLVLTLPAQAADPVAAAASPASTQNDTLMTTPRPLFYTDLVALDSQQHRQLTLPAERKNFAFAATANAIPLTAPEVSAALHNFPIVFIQEGDTIALIALTGLPNTGNRFVNAKGEWRPNTYIPAYVRGYPFIAVRTTAASEPIIAFDPNAADFKAKDGKALLDTDGQPGEQLKGILAFHAEYRGLTDRTHQMTAALKAEGVLEEGQMNLQTPNTPAAQINGFLVVNEGKLRALPPEALKRLMDADAIGLAYAHLFSMSNLGQIVTEPEAQARTSRRGNKKSAE